MSQNKMDQYIGVADYVVFSSMLVISVAIGFFYAYKDRRRGDMENYHLGNKKNNPVAVSVSISVTIISALSIIGVAAEVYTYGTMIVWELVGMFLGTAMGAHVFHPIFYNMDKIGMFEYFQRRFGTVPRLFGSFSYLLSTFIVMGFALYAPCLAFQAMTGISQVVVIVVAAFVCMLYTLLGGMKAVVWADTLQFVIIIAGMICMLVEGSKAVGGFGKAWEIANEHKRVQFFNYSFDPRTRHSIWALVIGYLFTWSRAFGANQAIVQRACSLPTRKAAKMVAWASFPVLCLIIILAFLNGIVMFAYYHTCDPVTIGRVARRDEIVPLMIVDVLGSMPGLPGLVLACLFSAALSTLSSGFNAISAVFIEDFVKPYTRKPLSEKKQLVISKVAIVGIAVIEFGIAAGISRLGGLLHQLFIIGANLFGAPLLGFFLCGVLFPWTNSRGIFAGLFVSEGFLCWLIFGAMFNKPSTLPLPVSIDGCLLSVTEFPSLNFTHTTMANISSTTTDVDVTFKEDYSTLVDFYSISYLWYGVWGTIVYIIVALIVSFLTGPTNPKDVDSKLMAPLFYNCCPFIPEKYRHKLLFGVDYSSKDDKDPQILVDTINALSKERSVIKDSQMKDLQDATHI